MLFDKTEDDLKKMMSPFLRMEYILNKKESNTDYELPIVVFAIGNNGKSILIDNPNQDKLGPGVKDMVLEEFDYGELEFDKAPGVYSAQFNWLTIKDEYTGDYDCELIVNNMACIWRYEND